MRNAHGISPAEAFLIRVPQAVGKPWTPVFIAIIDAGTAVILKVLARALNSIAEAAALGFVELARRYIPVAPAIAVSILAEDG